ncbi:MAG TPA: type II toxin-antitoxin system RelE/ParE family toxin [Chloroflexia bacterium]
MTEYVITFTQSARKELNNLSASLVNRIVPQIKALAQDPRPTHCRKVEGIENAWRIRIGDYRVIYQVFDAEQVVDIVAVRHRSQAYKPR